MIWNGVELYNVSDLTEKDGRLTMHRFPLWAEAQFGEKGQAMNHCNSGVEIRFNMVSDEVTVGIGKETGFSNMYVYYGSIPAGNSLGTHFITETHSGVTIRRPENMEILERVTKQYHLPFDPHLIRIVSASCTHYLTKIEGETLPPAAGQTPDKRLLCYGSSITHGSHALVPQDSYVRRTADALGMDVINLGLAGSAHLEPSAAEHIAERGDWDIAFLELGINLLKKITDAEFEARVATFLDILEGAGRPIYVTDLFYTKADFLKEPEPEAMRAAVKRQVLARGGNFHYIKGTELLTGADGLSSDLVHPNNQGMQQISENLLKHLSDVQRII